MAGGLLTVNLVADLVRMHTDSRSTTVRVYFRVPATHQTPKTQFVRSRGTRMSVAARVVSSTGTRRTRTSQHLGDLGRCVLGTRIYTQSGANGAIVNGMIIGGSTDGKTLYAEKVSHIQAHIGGTVLTTP